MTTNKVKYDDDLRKFLQSVSENYANLSPYCIDLITDTNSNRIGNVNKELVIERLESREILIFVITLLFESETLDSLSMLYAMEHYHLIDLMGNIFLSDESSTTKRKRKDDILRKTVPNGLNNVELNLALKLSERVEAFLVTNSGCNIGKLFKTVISDTKSPEHKRILEDWLLAVEEHKGTDLFIGCVVDNDNDKPTNPPS